MGTIGAWGLSSFTLFGWGGRMRFSKKSYRIVCFSPCGLLWPFLIWPMWPMWPVWPVWQVWPVWPMWPVWRCGQCTSVTRVARLARTHWPLWPHWPHWLHWPHGPHGPHRPQKATRAKRANFITFFEKRIRPLHPKSFEEGNSHGPIVPISRKEWTYINLSNNRFADWTLKIHVNFGDDHLDNESKFFVKIFKFL